MRLFSPGVALFFTAALTGCEAKFDPNKVAPTVAPLRQVPTDGASYASDPSTVIEAPATPSPEVTESAAMTSSDAALSALEFLRDVGIKLSVDDYGTGQSTLTYLKRLPASELKIDKSFIQTVVANRNDAILVRSTIDLAHELGLSVVGEGVEDSECLEALAAMGCDTVQGYHIGRPMAAPDFLALTLQLNAQGAAVAA